MADEIKIDVNVDAINRALRRYATKTKNLPMHSFATLMLEEVEEMFETEGEAGTIGKWDDLRPATLSWNPRRAGGQILQATGAMAAIQVKEVTAFSATIESPVGYAPFHLEGTAQMARRDFFAVNFGKVLGRMGDLVLQEYQR